MKVNKIDPTDADIESAEMFFETVARYFDLSGLAALDMFARNGAITVNNYSMEVFSVDAWELNREHLDDLMSNLDIDDVKIGCSYLFLEHCDKKYDFIVIDTPQGLHKDYKGAIHAEHFDVVKQMSRIMADKCIVVLYVNKKPYNKAVQGEHGYDHYPEYNYDEWMWRRALFYGLPSIDIINGITEEDALRAYRQVFAMQGYTLKNVVMVPCFSDVPGLEPYAFRVALELEKMTVYQGV